MIQISYAHLTYFLTVIICQVNYITKVLLQKLSPHINSLICFCCLYAIPLSGIKCHFTWSFSIKSCVQSVCKKILSQSKEELQHWVDMHMYNCFEKT